ncbi:MAG: BREX-2 system adenine-specific DNA-methyltransferase PglX, partial [Myxococcales bacterium]|nr:BREX-2 system adenine-specific DNA-methyltransferase PglX [Myxococcales bacterium]
AHLPGAREVFDARHNPVWVLAPSSDGARALLDFFQQVDGVTGAPVFTFPGTETRFLGDLYQDLSEAVRKRYALLQTPDFVEKFILEQTLAPAIEEFGLAEVKLIDPTCGSGHFLLGAFRDLLAAWQQKEPTTAIEELARRALDQVYGVDINPYAVAIARFRLVLAVLDAVGITRLDKAPALRPHVVVADSLLHRMKEQQLRLSGQLSMDEWASWGDALFRLAEPGAVADVLGQRYHAVVGNPPYITEKDATKREAYRSRYTSAAGLFALAAPFTERFFELAVSGGFIGIINSNAWAKRDYGKSLVESVLPKLDVQRIVDTAGCYLPGHGTPTLLLFGRNRAPTGGEVVAVLGKRGEMKVPDDPAAAPVWSEIAEHYGEQGFNGSRVSVEAVSRRELSRHPWILAGGGARSAFKKMDSGGHQKLASLVESVGFMCMTKQDEAFVVQQGALQRRGVDPSFIRPFFTGQDVREWEFERRNEALFPYDESISIRELDVGTFRFLFTSKPILEARKVFGGKNYREAGRPWWGYGQIPIERSRRAQSIAFAFVATHNNFVMHRRGAVLNQHAPIVTLKEGFAEADHEALLGYLNSSTVGFWCRLVMYPKGGATMGDGAIVTPYPWMDRLEYAGNLLQQLPVPDLDVLREQLLDLVIAAEETVQAMAEHGADKVVAATLAQSPSLPALRDARTRSLAERVRLRGILVSLQEEMDWRVYGIFGLPTVTAPSLDAVRVPVEPNHRPFEVRLAREVDSDISASEWFRVHKRAAPADVGGPLADLYQQRLRLLDDPERSRQLRLLETPETKRRWSPPDDTKAFREAVRSWLLERIEAVFREQPTPELRTARQLALDLGRDAAVQAAYELLTEDSGHDLTRLVSELVDAEGVPFLAGFRYAETGMETRAAWEDTWRLQRLEDDGKL